MHFRARAAAPGLGRRRGTDSHDRMDLSDEPYPVKVNEI
jgi:hypothetical protein